MRGRHGNGRRPLLAWVAMALAVGALGEAARAYAQVDDLVGRRIEAIEIHCAAPIDSGDLRRILPVQRGDVLRAGDTERVRARLLEREIFTAVEVAAEPRADAVALVVQLTREAIVNRVRFRGNDALSDTVLNRIVRVGTSSPFSNEARDFAVARIRERYKNEGFDTAQVRTDVSECRPGEVEVTFVIDEGEPVRVAAVEFTGDAPVSTDMLRRTAGIKPGDRYLATRQHAAQKAIIRRLRAEDYFEADVAAEWRRDPGSTGTLQFRVDPGPLFEIQVQGNHHFSKRRLLKLLDLLGRPIVTDGTWRELARRIRRAYQEDGYYFARVDVQIELGSPKVIRYAVDEGPVIHVAAVDFDGGHALSATALRAAMATQPPSWVPWRTGVLLDDVLDEDLKQLWYLYRRHGYHAAEIADVRTQIDRAHGQATVTVVIEEGVRTVVTTVEPVGLIGVRTLPELRTRPGVPLNVDEVEADRRALLAAQQQAGYPSAEVKSDVATEANGDERAATVRFVVTPGTYERVGTIIVQDNIDTKSRVVLRELSFHSGDPLDPEALAQSERRLYRLGLFRSVSVRPSADPAQDGARDVDVRVAEKAPGSIQFGGGYNTRDGFRAFGEISQNNLQGLGRRISLRGEVSFQPSAVTPNEYLGDLGFRDPRIADSLWAGRVNLIAQRSTRSVDQFSFERFAFVPAIERQVLPDLRAGVELQVEDIKVFDVEQDVLKFNPADDGRSTAISPGPFLVYDGRDDPFIPHRGVFDSLRVRYAAGWLGSDLPLIKVLGQHSQYIPIGAGVTFVYALRAGWSESLENNSQVPIRERFFLGGRTTVRGFSENSIGPTGSSGNPIGGDWDVNANIELRFPLFWGVGGAVFTDGGGVYLHDVDRCESTDVGGQHCAVTLDNFRRSAGLGVRYDTPVGPLSLDYGFKLDRRSDESIGEVHFSIGTIF
ncbi:MAG: outer membrane protein assembly factor BamA [Deltaproteobacteria bacterium]|nr:outer membrane protein assembly factor BamA [Deltaproteobacteria bacterium]MBI3386123.1 outer membrane protein assembly factor BamA [Deltaproteobacteria bacterium]